MNALTTTCETPAPAIEITEETETEEATEYNTEVKWSAVEFIPNSWFFNVTPDFTLNLDKEGREYILSTSEHEQEDMDAPTFTRKSDATAWATEFAEWFASCAA